MAKAKKTGAAPPAVPDVKLDSMLEGLLPAAQRPAAPIDPPQPEPPAIVGEIATAHGPLPDVAPEFRVPTPDELAAFPPPPPIAAPPPPPVAMAPTGSVFPQATMMADRSMHSGLVVGHVVEPPKIVVDKPPSPPRVVTFDSLPEKTKDEIRAGWLRTHGSMDGFSFGENNTPPPSPLTDPIFNRAIAEPPAAPDMSKLSAKTRAELQAGADRLAQRRSDYRAVLDKVAANNAAKHDLGGAPIPSNMDYAKGG